MTRFAALLVALLPLPLAAQQKLDHGYQVDADAAIRIQVTAGRVRVTGWDRDSIAVSGQITAGGGTYYGGGRGRAAKLGVESRDASGTGPGAMLEVRLPRRARVWIKTVTATIEVVDAAGELDLISVAGAITVTGAPKVVSAETIDGVLLVEGTELGVARLRSGGGNIVVRTGGGDITAASVGGEVDVTAERLDRARLESVTGAVRFNGGVAPSASLETESHGGDVTLRFTGPIDAEFTLASVAGPVYNRLSKGGETAKGKPLVFVVGNGTARISARSFKGIVTVTR